MIRVVFDTNVLVSALISPNGAPHTIVARTLDGELELIASDKLLEELADALAKPRIARVIGDPGISEDYLNLLRAESRIVEDPTRPRRWSRDRRDDFLVELALSHDAILATGDRDLLEVDLPIICLTPRDLLDAID